MKKTPFWKTWAALAVCAGLGAYVYFVESKREDKPQAATDAEKTCLGG